MRASRRLIEAVVAVGLLASPAAPTAAVAAVDSAGDSAGDSGARQSRSSDAVGCGLVGQRQFIVVRWFFHNCGREHRRVAYGYTMPFPPSPATVCVPPGEVRAVGTQIGIDLYTPPRVLGPC